MTETATILSKTKFPNASSHNKLKLAYNEKQKVRVRVSYLTWVVYESPHLLWMERPSDRDVNWMSPLQGKLSVAGLTLPFPIVAICYKNYRVATD